MKYACLNCGREKYIPSTYQIPKSCPKCGSPNLVNTRYCPFCKEHYYDRDHNRKCEAMRKKNQR